MRDVLCTRSSGTTAYPDAITKMVEHVDAEFAGRIPEHVGSVLYSAVDTALGR